MCWWTAASQWTEITDTWDGGGTRPTQQVQWGWVLVDTSSGMYTRRTAYCSQHIQYPVQYRTWQTASNLEMVYVVDAQLNEMVALWRCSTMTFVAVWQGSGVGEWKGEQVITGVCKIHFSDYPVKVPKTLSLQLQHHMRTDRSQHWRSKEGFLESGRLDTQRHTTIIAGGKSLLP